jgi:hypothetical protein
MTRKFTKMVFLGNGDASMAEVQRLHERLDEALSILSGLQQPPMATEAPDPDEDDLRNEQEAELRDVVRDVAAALLDASVDIRVHVSHDTLLAQAESEEERDLLVALLKGRLRVDADGPLVTWVDDGNPSVWAGWCWSDMDEDQRGELLVWWEGRSERERKYLRKPPPPRA